MQSIKIGWHVRAFAMGKNKENDGKKPRNRISKEERKKMTVSFIKKYQKLNGGSFPSLNLTQKEVGGSFYTTREIVREIIQENKILGSGDLLPFNNNDHSSVEMPLGTVLQFDIQKTSSDETSLKDEDSRYNVEVHALNNVSSADIPTHMEAAESEVIIVSEEVNKWVSSSHENENLQEEVEEKVACFENVTPLDLVSVQTSSSTAVSEVSDMEMVSLSENMQSFDEISAEVSSSMIISEDSNEKVVSNSHVIENQKVEVEEKSPQIARSFENLASLDAESSKVSSSIIVSDDVDEIVVATARNLETLLLEAEEIGSQKVPTLENVPSVDSLSSEASPSMENVAITNSTSEEAKNKDKRTELNGESGKGKLDRIHIETWEGSSRQEIHPTLAAFKSLVDAIVKYFTT